MREIVAGRHESERPQRQIGGNFPLGEPFDFDEAILRAPAGEPPSDEASPDGDADCKDGGCKKRTVSHRGSSWAIHSVNDCTSMSPIRAVPSRFSPSRSATFIDGVFSGWIRLMT